MTEIPVAASSFLDFEQISKVETDLLGSNGQLETETPSQGPEVMKFAQKLQT